MVAQAIGMVAALPALAIQLAFAASYLIFYFGFMFWFLSRPRKYVTTPDDPQIGLSSPTTAASRTCSSTPRAPSNPAGESTFAAVGGEMPKGMLLSGQPGTGKTFLAGCIAAEAQLPFIYVDASSLRGMFWGMDSLMVMKLFRDARGLARKYARPGQRGATILFVDELDSIGLARGGQQGMGMGIGGMLGGGSFGLNTMLNQMDSLGDHVEDRISRKILRWFGLIRGPVKDKPLVFVIGATNRPEVLDSALTRPGRLDRMLNVYPPDGEGRRDIISLPLEEGPRPRHRHRLHGQRLGRLDADHDQDDGQRGADHRLRRRPRLPHLQGLARRRRCPRSWDSSSRSARWSTTTSGPLPTTRPVTPSRPTTSSPRIES